MDHAVKYHLESLGLSKFSNIFEANEVDLEAFLHLSAENLHALLPNKVGPHVKILTLIKKLNAPDFNVSLNGQSSSNNPTNPLMVPVGGANSAPAQQQPYLNNPSFRPIHNNTSVIASCAQQNLLLPPQPTLYLAPPIPVGGPRHRSPWPPQQQQQQQILPHPQIYSRTVRWRLYPRSQRFSVLLNGLPMNAIKDLRDIPGTYYEIRGIFEFDLSRKAEVGSILRSVSPPIYLKRTGTTAKQFSSSRNDTNRLDVRIFQRSMNDHSSANAVVQGKPMSQNTANRQNSSVNTMPNAVVNRNSSPNFSQAISRPQGMIGGPGNKSPHVLENNISGAKSDCNEIYRKPGSGPLLRIPGYEFVRCLCYRKEERNCQKQSDDITFMAQLNINLSEFELNDAPTLPGLKAKLRLEIMSKSPDDKRERGKLLCVKVNDIFISALHTKDGTITVDIPDFQSNNLVLIAGSVCQPLDQPIVIYSLALVRNLTVLKKLENLKKLAPIPAGTTKELIVATLKESAVLGIQDKHAKVLQITLLCPLGKAVMETPVRGLDCKHYACFDALNFLKLYENLESSPCPTCNKSLGFLHLRTDEFFQAAINKAKECSMDMIDVDIHGNWSFPSGETTKNLPPPMLVILRDDEPEIVPKAAAAADIFEDNKLNIFGTCCICSGMANRAEGSLFQCKGPSCRIIVHQCCYGVNKNETQSSWHCKMCLELGENANRPKCQLCPSRGGALKKTESGKWVHIVCALFMPGAQFSSSDRLEIISTSGIQAKRFRQICMMCDSQSELAWSIGACMKCHVKGCSTNFHVTCAQICGLLCSRTEDDRSTSRVAYCEVHKPLMMNHKKLHFMTAPILPPLSQKQV